MSSGQRQLTEEVQLTGQSIINKLREAAAPPGKKGSWLKLLSDKQLAEVFHRLKLGQTSLYIAKMAQREWNVKPSSQPKSLARSVRSFRDKIVGELRKTDAKKEGQKEVLQDMMKRGKRIVDKLDGLGRLRWLIEEQTDRIQVLREREKSSIPFEITEKAVRNAKELLEVYLKFQIELGLLDSKPSEHNIEIMHRFDGLMANTFTDDGARLINAGTKFLELAEKRSLTLERKPDGSFALEGGIDESDSAE